MHLVPAPAVRLMKRRVSSRPGVDSGTQDQMDISLRERDNSCTNKWLNPKKKREKTYRIKTNNQELLIRKQNESDATSR